MHLRRAIRLGDNYSWARITQIMNLLMAAPDIQEAILFLPRVESGQDPVHLRRLQSIATQANWNTQRQMSRPVFRSEM